MRKSFWAWTLGFPLVVLGVAFVSWRHGEVTEREWQEMIATADRMQADLDAHQDRRPVLYGEAVEGRASDEYARAVTLLAPRVDERLERYRRAGRLAADSEAEVPADLLAECVDALAAVARGAHCEDVGFEIDWSRGFGVRIPSLKDYRALATVLTLTARQHAEAGRPERAAELLLDGMQLGRDLFHVPVLITSMIGTTALNLASYETLVEERLIDQLDPAALQLLSVGMARLDASLALTSRAHEAEIVMFARNAVGAATRDGGVGMQFEGMGIGASFWSRAGYGFSWARMSAAHVRDAQAWLDLLRATDGADWPERKLAVTAAFDLCSQSTNPVTATVTPTVLSVERSLYDAVAKFRLARAEVENLLSDDPSPIADPYGGTIVIHEQEGRSYARSRGADDPESALHRIEGALLTHGVEDR